MGKTKGGGIIIVYTLIRARRKTISLSLDKKTLTPVVRAPMRMPREAVDRFVEQHRDWIERQQQQMAEQLAQQQQNPMTPEKIAILRQQAKDLLPDKVNAFAARMEVQPTGITITSATTRWGSCSGKNRLSFPYRLMLLPEPLIDYIVVHELAHIREKNHSPRFYAVVEQYLPDYRQRQQELRRLQRSL